MRIARECTALQRTVPRTPTRTTCLALLLKIADARSERSGSTRDVTASWSRRPRLNNAIRQPPVGTNLQPALCRGTNFDAVLTATRDPTAIYAVEHTIVDCTSALYVRTITMAVKKRY